MKTMLFESLFLANYWTMIWPDDAPFAKLIIFIILGLLTMSFLFFLRHWKRYERETLGVQQIENKLDEWTSWLEQKKEEELEENQALIEEDEDIIYQPTIEIQSMLEGLSKDLIIADRLQTLDKLKLARVKVNVDVLQKLSLAAEAKQWTIKFPGYVMTLAMLLGMLGTFYGLSIMVLEIGDQLRSISGAEISQFGDSLSKMQGVLGGAGTAFSTTLAGLCCTIFVSFFNFLLGQKQAGYYDYLESFTAEKLLPSAFPDLEEGDVLDQISDRLKDSFEELNDTIDNNNEAIENLSGLYERFDEIITQVRSITTSEASSQMQGVINEMNTVNISLRDMIDKYENKRILQEIQELENSNKKFVERYNTVLTDANWIPNTKLFLVSIAVVLFLILGVQTYSVFFSQF